MTLLASGVVDLHTLDNLGRVQLAFRWVLNAHHNPRRVEVAVSARRLPLVGRVDLSAINCKIFVAAMQAAWASFMERCVPDVVSLVLYINHKVDRFPLTTNHLNTEFAPMP